VARIELPDSDDLVLDPELRLRTAVNSTIDASDTQFSVLVRIGDTAVATRPARTEHRRGPAWFTEREGQITARC
jgi:hypothetical protein